MRALAVVSAKVRACHEAQGEDTSQASPWREDFETVPRDETEK